MAINPILAVIIKGAEDWASELEPVRLDMQFSITKDLDPEPNEAEVEIYNLNADTRNRIIDPATRDTPIELLFAPFGADEISTCFVGEIETAKNIPTRPGMTTRLTCKSQQWNLRDKYIDPVTFEKGTPIQDVITTITDTIGLPVKSDRFAFAITLQLSQTLSGPAFLALQRFLYTYGLFAYICDGTLYISDVYEVPQPTVIQITKAMLVSGPEPTERKDAVDVLLHTITEVNNLDPFERVRKKRKKKRKFRKLAPSAKVPVDQTRVAASKKEAVTHADYVEYETVDDTIFGVEATTLGTPAINPDNIVQFEGDDQYYRVQVVTHQGDTREGMTTTIRADVYEEDVTPGGAF